jgi:hypothetical protein
LFGLQAKFEPSQNLLYEHRILGKSSSRALHSTSFLGQCRVPGRLQLRRKSIHKSNTSKSGARSRQVFSIHYNELDSSHPAGEKDKTS